MKKLFTVAVFMLFVSAVNGQLTIAPEAGLNYSQFASKSDDVNFENTSLISPKLGVNFNIAFFNSTAVYIQPGIFYSGKGSKYEFSSKVLGNEIYGDYKFRLNYLEIPVNLMIDFDLGALGGIFVSGGPYLGYALSGTQNGDTKVNGNVVSSASGDIKFGSKDDEISRLDYGLGLGGGYRFAFGLYAKAQAGLGFANIQNVDNVSHYNRVVTLSIGYNIKLKSNKSGN